MDQVTQIQSFHISDHLANERTYLAWLRTAFSLIGLGIATSKFGYYLQQMAHGSSQTPHAGRDLGTQTMGTGMVVMGALLVFISAIRYMRVKKTIEAQAGPPPFQLIWIVTALAFVFGASAILILFLT